MSELLTNPIFFHGIKGWLVVIGAILFSYFGFQLYWHGFVRESARFEAVSQLRRLVLNGQGPGLFFMAFGALVLIISLFSKVTPTETVTKKTIEKHFHNDSVPDSSEVPKSFVEELKSRCIDCHYERTEEEERHRIGSIHQDRKTVRNKPISYNNPPNFLTELLSISATQLEMLHDRNNGQWYQLNCFTTLSTYERD